MLGTLPTFQKRGVVTVHSLYCVWEVRPVSEVWESTTWYNEDFVVVYVEPSFNLICFRYPFPVSFSPKEKPLKSGPSGVKHNIKRLWSLSVSVEDTQFLEGSLSLSSMSEWNLVYPVVLVGEGRVYLVSFPYKTSLPHRYRSYQESHKSHCVRNRTVLLMWTWINTTLDWWPKDLLQDVHHVTLDVQREETCHSLGWKTGCRGKRIPKCTLPFLRCTK